MLRILVNRWANICLSASLVLASTVGHSQATSNRLMPPQVNMTQSGWNTTDELGNLTFGLPLASVPGEVPIPVAFGMNASYTASAWTTRYYDPDARRSFPVTNEIDRPVVGGVHFGYISLPASYDGTSVDGLTVLENGIQIADSQWAAFSSNAALGSTLNLPQAYQFAAVSTSTAMVDPTATYLAYLTPLSGIYSGYQSLINGHLPSGFGTTSSSYKVVMDKNLARVYALATSLNAWVPVLWVDRFGHYVTFQWVQATTGLPGGVTAITKVTALNQRGKGVVLRWANYTSTYSSSNEALLRLDYVGIHAPSVLINGYPGYTSLAPSGSVDTLNAMNKWTVVPSLVGSACRPAAIVIGPYGSLSQPYWSGYGGTAGAAPSAPPSDGTADSAVQTWTFTYDSNLAEVASIQDPRLLTTSFTYANYTTQYGLTSTLQPRGVSEAHCLDSQGNALWKRWTRSFTVTTSSTSLSMKVEGWWDPNQASSPDRYHQLDFQSDALNYGNGVYATDTLKDSNGTTWSTTQYTWNLTGSGVNGSLSNVQSVSVTKNGSPTITTSLGYANSSDLQVTEEDVKANSGWVSATTNTYQPRWDMLEGNQLIQTSTMRYKSDGYSPLGTVTQNYVYDSPSSGPSLLQLQESYLDGGTAGKHGVSYTYTSDGKPYMQQVYHFEGATGVSSPTVVWVTYDPSTGAPAAGYQQDNTNYQYFATQTNGAFDSASRPTTQTDSNGVTTTLTYDDRGRALSVSKPGSPTTTYTYVSETEVQTTRNGLTTTSYVDGFGRPTKVQSPTAINPGGSIGYTTTTTYYDSDGRKTRVEEVNSAYTVRSQRWSYDPLDRETSYTPYVGGGTTTSYPVSGINSGVTTTLSNGVSTTTYNNPLGQVVEVDTPDGTRTTTTYDKFGNKATVVIASSSGTAQTRSWFYDDLDRLTSKTEPETNTQTFANFNALNEPQTVTEASGTADARVRTLTFDGFGRLTRMANGSDSVSYTFTKEQLTSASRTSGGQTVSQSYQYYGPGALISSETTSQTGLSTTIGYGYDTLGRLQTLTYPDNRAITYGYDALSRINNIKNNGAPLVNNVVYHPWGPRYETQYASGIEDRWEPDLTGTQLQSWNVETVDQTTTLWSRGYGYDSSTHLLNSANAWSLQHDVMGHIKEADGYGIKTAHQFDAFGNDIVHQATANPNPVPGTLNNFTFNANDPALVNNNKIPGQVADGAPTGWNTNNRGEATTVGSATASPIVLGLGWDGLGLMNSVVWNYGHQTFLYAPSGMRVGVADLQTSSGNRKYAYTTSGLLLSEYLNPSGAAAWNRDVVYLGSQAIAEIDGSGVHELHDDYLGSPTVITAAANGSVEGTQVFGPYGELMSRTGSYIPLTGYTGHLQADPSGLIYMRGRYYSPAWHAFVNSDQGLDPSTWNQKAYVSGMPFMATDPSGGIQAVFSYGGNCYVAIWEMGGSIDRNEGWGWNVYQVSCGGGGGGQNGGGNNHGHGGGGGGNPPGPKKNCQGQLAAQALIASQSIDAARDQALNNTSTWGQFVQGFNNAGQSSSASNYANTFSNYVGKLSDAVTVTDSIFLENAGGFAYSAISGFGTGARVYGLATAGTIAASATWSGAIALAPYVGRGIAGLGQIAYRTDNIDINIQASSAQIDLHNAYIAAKAGCK